MWTPFLPLYLLLNPDTWGSFLEISVSWWFQRKLWIPSRRLMSRWHNVFATGWWTPPYGGQPAETIQKIKENDDSFLTYWHSPVHVVVFYGCSFEADARKMEDSSLISQPWQCPFSQMMNEGYHRGFDKIKISCVWTVNPSFQYQLKRVHLTLASLLMSDANLNVNKAPKGCRLLHWLWLWDCYDDALVGQRREILVGGVENSWCFCDKTNRIQISLLLFNWPLAAEKFVVWFIVSEHWERC